MVQLEQNPYASSSDGTDGLSSAHRAESQTLERADRKPSSKALEVPTGQNEQATEPRTKKSAGTTMHKGKTTKTKKGALTVKEKKYGPEIYSKGSTQSKDGTAHASYEATFGATSSNTLTTGTDKDGNKIASVATNNVAGLQAKTHLDKTGVLGTVELDAQALLGAQARGELKGTLGKMGIKLEGDAELFLGAKGELTLQLKSPPFKVAGQEMRVDMNVSLKALAGAQAKAHGDIAVGLTGSPPQPVFNAGVNANAEAFAGAKAGLQLDVTATWLKKSSSGKPKEIHLAKATGSLDARAGIGAEAHAKAGFKDGMLSFDVGASFTYGLGWGGSFGAGVNPAAVSDFAAAAGQNVATQGKNFALDQKLAVKDFIDPIKVGHEKIPRLQLHRTDKADIQGLY
jgi:hypothetical protein